MPNAYLVAGLVAAVLFTLGLFGLAHFLGRRGDEPVQFANDREERLTRRVAEMLRCSLAQALPWLRKELQIAPDQTDDHLVNRAAYHYRRSQPDEPMMVWRDCGPR
jgi:hypothetical protein